MPTSTSLRLCSANVLFFCCRILGTIFPKSAKVVGVVEGNRKMWVKMNNKVKQQGIVSNSSMDVLQMELGVEEDEDDFDDDNSTPKEEILAARANGKIPSASTS